MNAGKSTEGSTTVYALLGLLSVRPAMSGYDIRNFIPESIGHFWSESYGQIYPTLKRLTAQGLVDKKTERTKSRPDRHVYSVTTKGREQLAEWLALPAASEVLRVELLLKLFFGAHAEAGVNREHVELEFKRAQATLKLYESIRRRLIKERAADPQLPYYLMTLNRGRLDRLAAMRWCRETLRELDAVESGSFKRQREEPRRMG